MNRRDFLRGSAGALIGAVASQTGCAREPRTAPRNVLFVAVEDWNPRVAGCYGDPRVQTPHLDAFAATAVRFDRAFCQASGCNASRSSFLTGLRPESTRVFGNRDAMDELLPPGTRSLPELFRERGHTLVNVGKLFHLAHMAEAQLRAFDRLELCDVPEGFAGISTGYASPDATPRRFRFSANPEIERHLVALAEERDALLPTLTPGSPDWHRAKIRFRQFHSELIGDSGESEAGSIDGRRARLVAEILPELATEGRPFFLSVGFTSPHVPLIAPPEYLALYDPAEFPSPPAPVSADRGVPPVARRFGKNYDVFAKFEPTPERVRLALAAYYANVSFVDAQLGIVLQALEDSGLAEDTAVVVFADHGFHLGEHGLWSKVSLFDQSIRVPLLVRVPGAAGAGRSCDALVELVDLLPTLAELCDLGIPESAEGTSFAALLDEPDQPWKRAAFSYCQHGRAVGHALRSPRYRWSEWRTHDGVVPELYDLEADPWEQRNLARDPQHREVAREHAALLRAGWRAARPSA